VLAVLAAGAGSGCTDGQAVLTQLIEARRLASGVHLEFTKAAEASNRAVMAEADEASAAAADDARRARQAVERDAAALRPILEELGFREELGYLDGFGGRYDEYRRLDDEILPLAVENTNVKAQRLSFGAAADAADAFRAALTRAAAASGGQDRWRSEALAARGVGALSRVQVLHAPHIAEADLGAMDRMEGQMSALLGEARAAVEELKAAAPPGASPHLAKAAAALDRFNAVQKEIIALSRRNSDVQSLALSLGRKRTIAAQCEDQLRALEDALGRHRFTATR
jgi:hypothetical protein